MENEDLSLIAKSCGYYNSDNPETIIKKIDSLKSDYSEHDLIKIYNYLLSHSNIAEVSTHLIRALDNYRHPTTLSILADILVKEGDTNVRIMCAKAIANHKNTDAVSPLLYCLNNKNENYRLRLTCADALGKIGDKYAVAPLIEVVKDENEKSVYLRESAASALGMLGDIRALEPLVNILETKQGIMDKFSFLKERVIEAINKMGFNNDERVFKALKSALSDESAQVRIDAIEAIMNSEHPKSFETIKKALKEDNDIEVKKNALIALYNLSDRKIVDEVINSSNYPDELKITAVEILEEGEDDG